MSVLANLAPSDESIKESGDSVGGGSGPLDSGVYPFKVAVAYITESEKGAIGIAVHLETTENRTHRETVYITSNKEKGQRNYYEKDGEKTYLPGFQLMNSLALLTVGKELHQLETEKKTIKLYNYESRSEVATEVEMITELLGQEIFGGVIQTKQNKNKKGDDNKYHPTNEIRTTADLDKFFRASNNMTVTEIRAGAEEATFINQWRERWDGEVRDRTVEVVGAPGTAPGQATAGVFSNGAPAGAPAAAPAQESSIFANAG